MQTLESAVKYTVALAKKLTNEIGFIPATRYEDAGAAGRLLIQTLNDDPCGFLVFGPPFKGRIHVWQTAVQVDARRRQAATALLENLKRYAADKSAFEVVLRCRHDLEANAFWTAAGFRHFATSQGGRSRGGQILHYSLPIETPQLKLFPDEVEKWAYQSKPTSHRSAGSKPQSLISSKQQMFLWT
jgi:GNAT superfamily N-acetyltransferase